MGRGGKRRGRATLYQKPAAARVFGTDRKKRKPIAKIEKKPSGEKVAPGGMKGPAREMGTKEGGKWVKTKPGAETGKTKKITCCSRSETKRVF